MGTIIALNRDHFYNWSWWLDPNRPFIPFDVSTAKEEEGSASTVKAHVEEGAEVSAISPLGKSSSR